MQDIKSGEIENKNDYQREKQEISADIDGIEIKHMQDIKIIKD